MLCRRHFPLPSPHTFLLCNSIGNFLLGACFGSLAGRMGLSVRMFDHKTASFSIPEGPRVALVVIYYPQPNRNKLRRYRCASPAILSPRLVFCSPPPIHFHVIYCSFCLSTALHLHLSRGSSSTGRGRMGKCPLQAVYVPW